MKRRSRNWEGNGRQRTISLWSMGSCCGSGFAALFNDGILAMGAAYWVTLTERYLS